MTGLEAVCLIIIVVLTLIIFALVKEWVRERAENRILWEHIVNKDYEEVSERIERL